MEKFQFQYGAIKRTGNEYKIRSLFGFNSNMVRLREYANTQDVAHEMFQFQYGAIKSLGTISETLMKK